MAVSQIKPPTTEIKVLPGLHEIILLASTHMAVDDFIDWHRDLYQATPDEPVFVLLNLQRVDVLPLAYMTTRLRQTFTRGPQIPPTRHAYWHNDSFRRRYARTFFRTMTSPALSLRFFGTDERAEAEAWLRR